MKAPGGTAPEPTFSSVASSLTVSMGNSTCGSPSRVLTRVALMPVTAMSGHLSMMIGRRGSRPGRRLFRRRQAGQGGGSEKNERQAGIFDFHLGILLTLIMDFILIRQRFVNHQEIPDFPSSFRALEFIEIDTLKTLCYNSLRPEGWQSGRHTLVSADFLNRRNHLV